MPTILVLDEETDSRTLLKRLLELEGHRVITCSNQEECLGAAKLANPDLVIVNIRTRSQWSRGLLGLLKALNERPKILTIADHVSDQISGAERGDAFLVKPLDMETIGMKVREVLSRRN